MPQVDVNSQKSLSWDSDSCQPKTFRVQGQCQAVPPNDPSNPSKDCKAGEKQSFVANVQACNLEDAAKKVSDMNLGIPVKNVSVFNTTPSGSTLDPTKGPNALIDVTPSLQHCQGWCELLIDEDALQIVGVAGYGMQAFNNAAGGSVQIVGEFDAVWDVDVAMQGSMRINSLARCFSNYYLASAGGPMTIVGLFGEVSSHYVAAGSGSMAINSLANAQISHYGHTMSGSMVMTGSGLPGLEIPYRMSVAMRMKSLAGFSGANYHFAATASGIMIINGLSKDFSSYYQAQSSGSMTISGSFGTKTSFFAATGSGAMRILSLTKQGFHYGMSGNMTMSSGTAPIWRAGSAASGTMFMTSQFNVISPYYYYAGSGSMSIDSLTYTQYSDLGDVDVDLGVESFIVEPGIFFPPVPAPEVVVTTQPITVPCCVLPMPSLIEIKHNLLNIDSLNRFLTRNGLTLDGDLNSITPTSITMQYSKRLDVWRSSLHLRGLSPVTTGNETWDIDFEFGCTNQAGGGTLGSYVWRFASRMKVYRSATNQDFIIRYVLQWRPETVCSTIPFSIFDFDFNFQNLSLTPSGVNAPIFHDEGGLLSESPLFSSSPVLQIRLAAAITGPAQTYDWLQEDQLQEANHAADSSGHPR